MFLTSKRVLSPFDSMSTSQKLSFPSVVEATTFRKVKAYSKTHGQSDFKLYILEYIGFRSYSYSYHSFPLGHLLRSRNERLILGRILLQHYLKSKFG